MGVLKHLPPDSYFGLVVLKHFGPKFIKILKYIKTLCIFFMLNYFKYFEKFWSKKLDKKIHMQFSVPKYFNTPRSKMSQYPHIVYYRHTFTTPQSQHLLYVCMRLGHSTKKLFRKINWIFFNKSPIILERESLRGAKVSSSNLIIYWKNGELIN